ncbi:hypothetical protein [Actinomadura sp. 21ATH]|uniref:hypothetical protein n=1 Tax=Actinomadura sp. 21ATH TaxID=1735444 RepID=UPI0035BF9E4A
MAPALSQTRPGRPRQHRRRRRDHQAGARLARPRPGRPTTTSQPGRTPTLAAWMTTWLNTIAIRRVSTSTMDSTYRPKVEQWIIPGLGHHRLDRLRPEHLDAFYMWLAEQGLAANTILQIHRILSRALKVAAQREVVARNVATLVDAPQAEETR